MALEDLKDLYVAELQDLYSANRQARALTEKLAAAASDEQLSRALKDGVRGIDSGLEVVGRLVERHDAAKDAELCRAMQGLVREAETHVLEGDIADPDVRDAAIIVQYQRMVHYALAGYGSVAAFAKRLGRMEEAEQLADCLEQTRQGDERMTALAEDGINAAAAR
jgi:ferritin-like metal-binding protein YciE